MKELKKINPNLQHIIQDDIIDLYKKELEKYNDISSTTIFLYKNQINSLLYMIDFFESTSKKNTIRFIALFEKLVKTEFISSTEVKTLQTLNYSHLKYNNPNNFELQHSFLFGVVLEKSKGYYFEANKLSEISTYLINDNTKKFFDKLLAMVKKYNFEEDLDKERKKIIAADQERMKIFEKKTKFTKKLDAKPEFKSDEEKESFIALYNSESIFFHGTKVNGTEGRVYNSNWNNISKGLKTILMKDSYSYDINASVYQFLFAEYGQSKIIKLYIDKKVDIRLKVSSELNISVKKAKKIISSLVFRDSLSKLYMNSSTLYTLYNEIKRIKDKYNLHGKNEHKKSKLFSLYELWEAKKVKELIKHNHLNPDDYITNHDELLTYKKLDLEYQNGYIFEEEDYNTRLESAKDEFMKIRLNENRDEVYNQCNSTLNYIMKIAYSVLNRRNVSTLVKHKWDYIVMRIRKLYSSIDLMNVVELKELDLYELYKSIKEDGKRYTLLPVFNCYR